MKLISSPDNPKYKAALKLATSRGRQKQNRIAIFGAREVQKGLAAGIPIDEAFICRDRLTNQQLAEVDQSFSTSGVPIWELPPKLFEKLAFGERSDGLLAIAPRPATDLARIRLSENPLLVVLQSVEKPGNIGAVARSADAIGADALILADSVCDVFHPNAIRASMGCVLSLQTAVCDSNELKAWLEKNNVAVVAARVDAAKLYFDVDFRSATAIVLGSEAHGLTDDWRGFGVNAVRLPMRGFADSLNVSVTAAVLMFEAARQRNQVGGSVPNSSRQR